MNDEGEFRIQESELKTGDFYSDFRILNSVFSFIVHRSSFIIDFHSPPAWPELRRACRLRRAARLRVPV
jgi:hypothetical protein